MNKVFLNTLVTYLRTVCAACFALFANRWVLASLGASEYGMFGVVGSLLVFVTLLNGIMWGSTVRYFAYCVGKGNAAELKVWYNVSIRVHFILACVLVVIGWPVGECLIRYVLNIPALRVDVCVVAFRCSLFAAWISMVCVPTVSMFMAKQEFVELSLIGMVQSALTFLLALLISNFGNDHFLVYAIGVSLIMVAVQICYFVRGIMRFPECRISLMRLAMKGKFSQLFSFAGWNLIGELGLTLRDQGAAVMLNLLFGTTANASYGIASQVAVQTNQLSQAMVNSFSPEITATEGRGDRKRMLQLSNTASKFGMLLVSFLAIPLIMEMEFVLRLWLHNPPPHAANLCRLMLIMFMIERPGTGAMLAINAGGNIAKYQMSVGIVMLFTLPIAWLIYKLGFGPESVGYAFVVTMFVTTAGRAFWMRKQFDLSILQWCKQAVLPSTFVVLPALTVSFCVRALFVQSFFRLLINVAGTSVIYCITSWLFALNKMEQVRIKEFALAVVAKIKNVVKI